MKKAFKLIVGLALTAAAAAGGYHYWQSNKDAILASRKPVLEAPKPPAISVVRVETADFTEKVLVSGSIIAREDTIVSPEIEGYKVLELFADAGTRVKKGDILARLEADQLEAQLAQNEANIAAAQAQIARSKSQITEAGARLKEAKAQLERAVPLKKSGYLSETVYDQRESAARAAEAQFAAAKDGLTASEAQKKQVEAQRSELEWKRSNTEVRAPVDGVVSSRNARIGAIASSTRDPMFRVIQNGEFELDAEIVETDLGKIRESQKARVTVTGVGDISGTVRLISPQIDQTTRLGRVRIFLGENDALRLGTYARGVVETATSRGVGVPPSAVMFDASGAFVQVVTDGKVARRDVTTGLVDADRIEVRNGLKDGELVVEKSGTFLRDGDIIDPVIAGAAGGSGKTAEVK